MKLLNLAHPKPGCIAAAIFHDYDSDQNGEQVLAAEKLFAESNAASKAEAGYCFEGLAARLEAEPFQNCVAKGFSAAF